MIIRSRKWTVGKKTCGPREDGRGQNEKNNCSDKLKAIQVEDQL